MNEQLMKQEFDKWIALLEKTNNNDMLKDPYNIWVEAWSIAAMLNAKKDPTKAGS